MDNRLVIARDLGGAGGARKMGVSIKGNLRNSCVHGDYGYVLYLGCILLNVLAEILYCT